MLFMNIKNNISPTAAIMKIAPLPELFDVAPVLPVSQALVPVDDLVVLQFDV